VKGRYSNRPDLLEQLRNVVAILSDSGQGNDAGAEVAPQSVVCSRRLRDRFSLDNLQVMIDLYRSATTAKQVAEKFRCQPAEREAPVAPVWRTSGTRRR
jgi:hypothetical protein